MKERKIIMHAVSILLIAVMIMSQIASAAANSGSTSNRISISGAETQTANAVTLTVNRSNTIEFVVSKATIPVYTTAALTTRGAVYNGAKHNYNAYLEKGDVVDIIANNTSKKAMQVKYRNHAGDVREGWISYASAGWKNPSTSFISKRHATTYKWANGAVYGEIYDGDVIMHISTYTSGNTKWVSLLYTAKAGSRSMKWACIPKSEYDSLTKAPQTIKVFQQSGESYSGTRYGYSDRECTKRATIGSGGCGLLAMTNLVFDISNQRIYIPPKVLCDFSLKNNHRANGEGTKFTLYSDFCNKKGSTYSIEYKGTTGWKGLKSAIQAGNGVICSVYKNGEGHIMAITRYESGKYLLLDSAAASKRGTQSTGYKWATETELKNMGMRSTFYIIGTK